MIGLLLIYYVGKAFYHLAEEHHKNNWGFAILGVLSYYAGSFIGGIVLALLYEFYLSGSIEDVNNILLSLIAMPFGILACWGFYKILQRAWSKPATYSESEDILDADLINKP